MQNQELSRQLQKLQTLVQSATNACGESVEMQSHWAKYICVLTSGFLENAIKELYGDFATRAASPSVATFVYTKLKDIRNPNSKKFLEIARSFRLEWEKDLSNFLNDEGRKEAIDSVMSNRHLIAHGKDSGITLVRVKEYLKSSVKVLEFIEEQCRQ